MTKPEITLRPVAKRDLDRLHGWLNAPHLKPWYVEGHVSRAQVARQYIERSGRLALNSCFVAAAEGEPYGFVQCYRNADHPDYGLASIGLVTGVTIDYFIGEKHALGRGLGQAMLHALVRSVGPTLAPQHRAFQVFHRADNRLAIRCCVGAGFTPDGSFRWQGREQLIFTRSAASPDDGAAAAPQQTDACRGERPRPAKTLAKTLEV